MSVIVNTPVFRGQYSESFKRQVVRELETGGYTLSTISRKYGIRGHVTVARWYGRYSKFAQLSRQATMPIMMSKQQQTVEPQEQERVRELERALADAQLKIRALETLIDLAEETYQIPVRKNSGAKQSNG